MLSINFVNLIGCGFIIINTPSVPELFIKENLDNIKIAWLLTRRRGFWPERNPSQQRIFNYIGPLTSTNFDQKGLLTRKAPLIRKELWPEGTLDQKGNLWPEIALCQKVILTTGDSRPQGTLHKKVLLTRLNHLPSGTLGQNGTFEHMYIQRVILQQDFSSNRLVTHETCRCVISLIAILSSWSWAGFTLVTAGPIYYSIFNCL